ncbi:ATP-dependent RNA helicase HrpA [Psychrosphaera saromensis]|uniref:RNA helicase n=1 Tax=Psychrosphaera saromensis TaxID=716813 RepID=A0A2S7V152_9GAMM|nr:ATP-dependent RNA helicase HrpA [Psychrosphaera saromensis]
MVPEINSLNLKQVLKQDLHPLSSRLRRIQKIQDLDKQSNALDKLQRDIDKSIALRETRIAGLPKIEYPEQLPVSQKHVEIKKAISENQVVIIAGETGSGKTTQIPKMCMELGRGIEGKIGHTQPRRLAARSVATRICDELGCEMGTAVGYKVRFSDHVGDNTYVKLMTDGVLLAEMQHDRYLNQYDTIIIDEAHERSLNIDFILGYLRELLPKRPDLKVIITSATIDPQSFSEHFKGAPIIEVTGRTFPVEVRYRPLDEVSSEYLSDESAGGSNNDNDQITAIYAAVDELARESSGDILLFMNGEREIRDTADALAKRNLRNTEILPLYARLSATEQNRIFAPHHNRRIILATNVAETSLTVPGIKYVIDTGTARISRYSYKSKVQRLPIEPISQASANQRKGRCGRTEAGICIRLFSEDDFLSRPEFTAPEILRTNLASVILQMMSLNLGDLEDFPFIQKPDSRFINDGLRLLEELQAITENTDPKAKSSYKLTPSGKSLSRIPVDPRLAKMIFTAASSNCLHEIIVIVAALSIQDPRERPSDFKQKSDELHKRFKDKDSDFVAYLNLWDYLIAKKNQVSGSQFRKQCKQEFLNYMRIREWQDLVYQIEQSVSELGFNVKAAKAQSQETRDASAQANALDNSHDELNDIPTVQRDYQGLHQALLSGLLSHIGQKEIKDTDKKPSKDKRPGMPGYEGARNSLFHIFPGSHLFKTSAKWVMAAELVETSKLFARYAARIQPEWVEPLAQHVMTKNYSEPHWSEKQGSVQAFEKQTLYGLVIVPKRRVNFDKIDPVISREIFIRDALVNGQLGHKLDFLAHNSELMEDIQRLENKVRRRDLLVDEEELIGFYQKKLPKNIASKTDLLKWIKNNDQEQLKAKKEDFMLSDGTELSAISYPDFWRQGNLRLPLDYDFEPGEEFADGISVRIPLPLLNQVTDSEFDWHIPAYRHELIMALIKSLPKQLRRNFVPAPNYADALLQRLKEKYTDHTVPFIDVITEALFRMTGVKLNKEDWVLNKLEKHLKINFRVVDDKENIIGQGFNLDEVKASLQQQVKKTIKAVATDDIEKTDVKDWDFGDLPASYMKSQGNYQIKAFPALVKTGSKVNVELLDHEEVAEASHLAGIVELIFKTLPSPIKHLQQKLPNKSKLVLYFNPFGQIDQLISDCIRAVITKEVTDNVPRTQDAFNALRDKIRGELNDTVFDAAMQVEKILLVGHKISKQLKGKISFDMIQANAYIKAHLDSLIYKGFVSECGIDRLPDIYRYVLALEKRLEKIKIDANKDRMNQIDLDKIYDLYDKLTDKLPKELPIPTAITDVYWMIEELRVSLFAQGIGTKYPISIKRIKQAINELG